MKKILGLFLGCVLLLTGCYEEGDLTPSPESELIYGKYTLPQGDHDYDDYIVKFYKQNSSLLLYKFTSKDFGWSPSSNISWNIETDTIVIPGAGSKYDARPADELFVKAQLQLLDDKLFTYLSDTMMKLLPQRILLCSVLDIVPTGLGHNPKPEERKQLNAFGGYYHIAVNWGNSKILTMTAQERNQFKIDVCTVYFGSTRGLLGVPMDFFNVSSYSDKITSSEIYANGILDHGNRTSMDEDWFDYLKLAIGNSIRDLEAEGGVLNPAIDVNGKIREKYTIMVNFFKSKYHFDIQAIGNDVEY